MIIFGEFSGCALAETQMRSEIIAAATMMGSRVI
jgi:hypothetical protein